VGRHRQSKKLRTFEASAKGEEITGSGSVSIAFEFVVPFERSSILLSVSADIYDPSAALKKQQAEQKNTDKETKIVPNTVVQDLIDSRSIVE
jgi:hypothetical protein